MINSLFTSAGNDAIDVSGSLVNIDQVSIDLAGDKGISVGEDSQVAITNSNVSSSRFGIVSKDLSNASVQNCTIKNTEIGFAAYRKKGIFGPGEIEAEGVKLIENQMNWLLEHNSKLVLEGSTIKGNLYNLVEAFY